jgi:O-antigen/teichoic acid export membrane protein
MLPKRAALWRDRSFRFALGGGATVVTAVFAVVRNKWLAEHLSTAGLGVLAQVFSAQTWLGTAAGLGLSLPVAQAVGAATAASDGPALRRGLRTALGLVGGATLAVVILGLLLAPWLSQALLGSAAHGALLRIAMLGATGLAFQAVANGFFAGRSDLRSPLVMALAGGIVAVAVTMALVPRAGLMGGAIGSAVLVPSALLAVWWFRRPAHDVAGAGSQGPGFDAATGRMLLRVGLAALTLALLDQGTLLALRAHYLRANGVPANGLLQAALALAQQVSAAFMVYLTGYAFGRISGAGDAAGIRDYTRRHWRALLGLAAAAFAVAMLFASPLIALFYSDRFVAARPLMAWALFAEFCRVMTQVWGLGALPIGGLRVWMPIGIAGPVAFVPAYALLAPVAGVLALPYAAVVAALAQLTTAAVLMSRRGVTLRAGDATGLAIALAGLALLARAIAG